MSEPKATTHLTLKDATIQLYNSLKNDDVISKNPLQQFTFEHMASRSYLYYYRAAGYARMAKNQSQPLALLNLALDDLKEAKATPSFDVDRIDQLTTDILKNKIIFLHKGKKYQNLIDAIEQLPVNDRRQTQYIVYYANALFKTKQLDDFKKIARTYKTTLSNVDIVKLHVEELPAWSNILAHLPAHESLIKPAMNANVPVITKDQLLAEPQHLARLDMQNYLQSDALFKTASELYFASERNLKNTPAERKFIAEFRGRMHKFAPTYVDNLITSFWKKSDLKTAKLLSFSFLKHFEGHPSIPKVLYNLGRLYEDGKEYRRAADTYKKFIAKSDDKTYLELALFRAGWMLYLNNQIKPALRYFTDYLTSYPEGRYASTSEYFLLILNAEQAGSPLHQQRLEAFIKKYPLNLYTYILIDQYNLSPSLLRETFAHENLLASNNDINEFKADITTLRRLRIYQELKDLKLYDDAIKALKNISVGEDNLKLNLYMAAQFQELADISGEISHLIKVAGIDHPYRSLVPWRNLFPNHFAETIKAELKLQNLAISPLLVLSIIRQESAFDKSARSTADALGLMQLTAGTANRSAKKLQLGKFSLLDENDNLRLGIKTFADLLEKYGRVDYALSAYNAGETPTDLWIQFRGHLAPIAFIESIPYPETRVYIKGILRNWAINRMLYEDNPSPLVMFNK